MKLLIFVAVFATVFVAVRATDSMERLTTGLARMFEIKAEDVKKCIHKTGATEDEFRVLGTVLSEPEVIWDTTEVPESERKETWKTVKRAMCAVTCCAQTQGSMIGSQIQVQVFHDQIKRAPIPREAKPVLAVAVTECSEEVKDITEECEAAYAFVTCLAAKLKYFGF